ncbi:MAG TPA: DUF1302 family protein [Burkholderiales bacterium]|nr:DUF1302 family protein [Burkholderiales bacterium]
MDLGATTVHSSIGQPLNVEVELVALKPGEDKTITVRLGSRQAHEKAGIDVDHRPADLKVSVGRRDGRPVLRLRTVQPVKEAFMEAVIVLGSSAGTTTHRYTAFLRPPGSEPAKRSAQRGAPPTNPKPLPAPSPALEVAAGTAAAAAPLSRDELFGLPAREEPPTAQAAPGPGSRDELFGVPAAEKAPASGPKPLEWHGFVQNTTAYDYQDPQHWSRAVVRTQLGTQGGSGNFKWKASARLDVDPVYFNSGFYPEPVRDDQRANFMLRETYIDTSLGALQFRLGKQHIVWGEMVGIFVADVVSARDQRDFILPDFDILRIPQWAARAEYFGENSHAEIIWLPYPAVDNIGKPGAEFYPYRIPPPPGFEQQFNNDVTPERNLKNSNFGARVSTLQSGWDLAAFYYRSTDVSPTFYREVALAPTPTLTFTPRHDRIWQAGGTVTKDFRSFVGKAEAVYTGGRKFNVTRLAEPEGVVPQDTLDYAFGLDFTLPHETRLNVQYFERVFFDHDPDLLQDQREGGVTLLINTKIAGSFTPELLILQSVNRNDRLARAKLGWGATQNLALTVGVDVFTGQQTGFFGRFNDRDRVYFEARYDF